jgi:hypothetical protein
MVTFLAMGIGLILLAVFIKLFSASLMYLLKILIPLSIVIYVLLYVIEIV